MAGPQSTQAPTVPAAAPTRRGKLLAKSKHFKGAIVAIAGLGAVIGGLSGYWTRYQTVKTVASPTANAAPTTTVPLSILVLPFANQTGDPQKAYIADALTSSITSDLSRIRDAFVVPASTAFAYKDKALTVKQVAADAAVRFVLHGSVQSTGDKLRINAQLLDSQTGVQLWSESFDGELANLFALQDLITTRIGISIGREMVIVAARESESRKSSPKVADLMLRARALGLMPQSSTTWAKTISLYREALAQEPNNVEAMTGLAAALVLQASNFLDDSDPLKEKQFVEGRDLAFKAKAIDPANLRVLYVLRIYAKSHNDFAGALRAAETLYALSPKSPSSLGSLANILAEYGEPGKAIDLWNQRLAINPKGNPTLFGNLSGAHLMLGDNDAAIKWGLKAVDADTEHTGTYASLAMAYSNKGDAANAAVHAAEYRRRAAADGRKDLGPTVPKPGTPAAYVKYWNERYVPEWKKAGLP
jgi:TolB-like protein